jgi:acetyl/propionyl-CoA carboxylase alpha subunit
LRLLFLGDILMTMVAMKMEHTIKAPKDGVIKQVIGIEGEVLQKNFVRRVNFVFRPLTGKHYS